jgi:tyrosyl-tRNA synthetase
MSGDFELLAKGCVDVVTAAALRQKLARGQPLTVKVGFDPTAPDIHLGHTVLMRKMKHFQDQGHRVVFVIGDFTGMIGDPTGKSKTRPPLTRDEIEANAETYKKQAFKILDPARTEVRFNREWLGALGSDGLVRLAATYNVARMLERRDFQKRYDAGQPISVHEFLYPLAQAYDSVALKADVELGGTDQLFNLNVGRDIMPAYGLEPQVVMTTPLLEGLDGVEKMSKSLGNYIGVTDPPLEIFSKAMSISDDLMWKYYTLLTDLAPEAIATERGRGRPMDSKLALAGRLVADFHGAAAAQAAAAEWRHVHQERQAPAEMPVKELRPGSHKLREVLAATGLAPSKSEAQRLIRQRAVKRDGVVVESDDLAAAPGETFVISVGAVRFVRIEVPKTP